MTPTICYVAGKSGGHIVPALTLAQQFKHDFPSGTVLFFSTDSPLDQSLLANNALVDIHQPLTLGNVPRRTMLAWPKFLVHCLRAFWISWRLLRRYQPSKVVSTGGYISVPVCMVARLLRIPVELYGLDLVPGEALKVVSRWAATTHICFTETKTYLPRSAACSLGAYPLRYRPSDRLTRDQACSALGVDANKTIICVLGGSQGSRFMNTCVQEWIATLADASQYVIMHQTGANDKEQVAQWYQERGVAAQVFAYRDDIHLCYAAADGVIARAGAGTLFEILFFNTPAFIIPLEVSTTTHQRDNALSMQARYPDLFTVALQGEVEKDPSIAFQRLGSFCKR